MDLFFLTSVSETRNPIKPVNISVTINPTSVKTKTSSWVTAKSVEKIRIETVSLTPKPAKVIGKKPATFATGNSNKKLR